MQEGSGAETTPPLMRAAMIVVVLAVLLGWFAAGAANDSATSAADANSAVVARTATLADSTAALAVQVQTAVDALTVATGSAGEASSYTVKISEQVRALIEALADVDGQQTKAVEGVRNVLANAEASLLETEGGLNESNTSLADISAPLGEAVTALQLVPEQLRSIADDLDDAGSDADVSMWLWRLAIVFVGVVLMFLLSTVDRLTRRVPAVTA